MIIILPRGASISLSSVLISLGIVFGVVLITGAITCIRLYIEDCKEKERKRDLPY